MRIYVSQFKSESNSFNPILTNIGGFQRLQILRGQELFAVDRGLHVGVAGFMDAIAQYGGTAIPGLSMCSGSGGAVTHQVAEDFIRELCDGIRENLPLDGAFLSLHGATLSDQSYDVCGDILAAVRQALGPDAVICVSLDLHANLTEKMLENADFIAGYHTYPHLDHYETSKRIGVIGLERLRGRPLYMYRAAVPMMASASDYTTQTESVRSMMDYGDQLVAQDIIQDYSVFQVQPWIDVPEMSSSIVVVAEDQQKGMESARALSRREFDLRASLKRDYYSVDETISLALHRKSEKPVILVDSADSPNAGATCDSAEVLRHLLPHADALVAAFPINDPEAAQQAFRLGVGSCGTFSLGAKLAPQLTTPVTVQATVKSLHDGSFCLEGPANRGGICNVGPSAVLTVGKLQILVCSYATKIGDLQFFRGFGIEPTLCDLVIVKACTSFRTAYEPISDQICNTQTNGAANADLLKLPFRHIPRPMYPFDQITEADILPPRCYRKPKDV